MTSDLVQKRKEKNVSLPSSFRMAVSAATATRITVSLQTHFCNKQTNKQNKMSICPRKNKQIDGPMNEKYRLQRINLDFTFGAVARKLQCLKAFKNTKIQLKINRIHKAANSTNAIPCFLDHIRTSTRSTSGNCPA
jgi:hypothetical protein